MHLLVGHAGDSCCAGVLELVSRRAACPPASSRRRSRHLHASPGASTGDGLTQPARPRRRARWRLPASWCAVRPGSIPPAGHPRITRTCRRRCSRPPSPGSPACRARSSTVPRPHSGTAAAPRCSAGARSCGAAACRPRAAHHQRPRRGPRVRAPPRGRRRRRRGLHAPDRREPATCVATDAAWHGPAEPPGAGARAA